MKVITSSFWFLAPVAGNFAALIGAFRSPFEQAGYAPCGYGLYRGSSLAKQRVADTLIVEAVVAGDRLDGAGDHDAVRIDVESAPVGRRLLAPGRIFDAGYLVQRGLLKIDA